MATPYRPRRPSPRPRVPRQGRGRGRAWEVTVAVLALLVAAPVLVVVASVFQPAPEVWGHLAGTVLPDYVRNSFALLLGVGLGTLLLGVGTAWLITMCTFPGRRLFEWALLLPLAMPAYLLAYAYTDFLQFAGPVQSTLRDVSGLAGGEYWFPRVRSLGGAVVMLTLTLYPYVYLLTRAAFLEQSVSILEASRSLGRGPWASFFRVSLPLARPSIAAGVALAAMETLSDFGTVEYFGVVTFTTGIYRTWFGLGERAAAAQLAALLLAFVLLALLLERGLGRRPGEQPSGSRFTALTRFRLRGGRAAAALLACALPIGLGALLPGGILARMAWGLPGAFGRDFWEYASNTVTVATLAAVVTVAVGTLLAYGKRIRPSRNNRILARVASMGYAVPGSVIAVGVLMHLGWLDGRLNAFAQDAFGVSTGLLLSGTLVGLTFAYVVRFLAVAYGGIEASLSKITSSMDDAARSLGRRSLFTLLRVHLPLLRGSLATALLLVFVEVTKELPATLIVRPFDFDTLAVRVYRLASDERLAAAAPGALAIAVVGLVPVLLLSRRIARSRPAVARE